jgi:glyoxylase-like metal-dependent hydrolase (beta-lactamase superfamily II)/rhodanese-related sulfurtransferase
MIFRQLFDASTSTYTYLLGDEASGEAILIDPVREQVERDLKLARELGLSLKYILDTHVHADHITGAGALRSQTSAQTVGALKGAACADLHVAHGETLHFGHHEVRVLATPGHTDDSVSYLVGDRVFTGDALLIRGCGRTDFQNGDPEVLYDSITRVLFALPDETLVYPGHDYRGHAMSSIGEEKAHNPRLLGKSASDFVELMNNLNLPHPRLIDEAVPANRACGTMSGTVARIWSAAQIVNGVPEIGATEASDLVGQVRFIDVREPHEYHAGHIAVAELVPLRTVADAAAAWSRSDPLVVVCRSGRRSAEAGRQLLSMGFSRVLNLKGGVTDWQQGGRELKADYAQVS